MTPAITGVYCASVTPVHADLTPDLDALATHAQALIADGCDGVALLGTTGEANSFSLTERRHILEAAVDAVGAGRLMPGTGVNAPPETVELTRHALSLGVTRVVMLPPSYYKGVSDEGLFRSYAQVIEKIGDNRLQVVLYHIPQVSGISISHDLIDRLITAFPKTVVGIKDSAGKIENMAAMIARFPGFAVFAGADPLLLPLMGMGGAGCITATSNLVADSLATVYRDHADASKVAAAQARINAFRDLSNSYVQIPAIKAMVAFRHGKALWARMRPPLVGLSAAELDDLKHRLTAIGASVKDLAA